MPRAQRLPDAAEQTEERSVQRRVSARRPPDPLAYRVDDAAAAIGVSRAKVWDLIAQGAIPARKIVGSTIILKGDLEAYLSGLPSARPPST